MGLEIGFYYTSPLFEVQNVHKKFLCVTVQGLLQESVQAQFFLLFFSPQGTKMTFQRFFFAASFSSIYGLS